MNLHKNIEEFNNLANVVSKWKNIPENAVKRDYYIVLLLNNLSASKIFKDKCVFKGGTSLSKCYPNSIERFSEDIDLTYLGMDEDDKTCEKQIYELIKIMTIDANTEKIPGEGNKRNKSRIVWFGDDKSNSIKLEIGSSVKPDPYSLFKIKNLHSRLFRTK